MTSADPLAMRDYYARQRFRRMRATCDDWRRPVRAQGGFSRSGRP